MVALTLRQIGGSPLPRWSPGAHVDLILDGVPTRQYSLCGDPADHHVWRLGILRDADGGGGSRFVHDQLRAGDMVRVRGPRNNFGLADSPRYLFIAGGIGITPILPMIAAAQAAAADWQLLYGGRCRASMAFLGELARYGDRVTVAPQDETGLLDLDSLPGHPAAGHPGLLLRPRTPAGRRRGTLPRLAAPVAARGAVQRPAADRAGPRRGLRGGTGAERAHPDDPADRSILDVVEEAGVGVLSSCAEGTCGTCETAVLDGLPDHRDSVLTEEERRAGDCMMICVSRSCTERLVLDL